MSYPTYEGIGKVLREERNVIQAVKYFRNPILTEGKSGEWDSQLVGTPMVVKNPFDGKYYMFYSGQTETECAIGVAVSDNGLDFIKYDGNPILRGEGSWETKPNTTGWVLQPFVQLDLYTSKKWVMYYAAFGSDWKWRIGRATCEVDKFPYGPWVKEPANPILEPGGVGEWDERHVKSPSVFFDPIENRYVMYYTGYGKPPYNYWQLGRALSDDGITWIKDADNPLFTGSRQITGFYGEWDGWNASPEVMHCFRYKGWVFLFYEGSERGPIVGRFSIGAAASRDGKNFFRYPRNPILAPGDGSQNSIGYDSWNCVHPYVLIEQDRVLLYYSQSNGAHVYLSLIHI